jgi:hypothetical protein
LVLVGAAWLIDRPASFWSPWIWLFPFSRSIFLIAERDLEREREPHGVVQWSTVPAGVGAVGGR